MKSYRTYKHLRQDLATGDITCRQIVTHYLTQIKQKSSLNLFLEIFEEEALQAAYAVDQKLSSNQAGSLAGMVIGIKDVLCYRGHVLTAGSRILSNFESLFTATAVQRLIDQDAIIIGRLNCDEFAMGSSNENSYYGPSKNPIDPDRVPGGSSGASAAAVAADMCFASLGSDTGGSVRQPASFCGVVGLKPTYGRISRWGLIAYASSFDQIGPITRSVEDAALLLQIMAGSDTHDNTASLQPIKKYDGFLSEPSEAPSSGTAHPKTIGYFPEMLQNDALDPEIRTRTESILDKLSDSGHTLTDLSFSYLDYLVPCYYILTTAEASSNLSRFDGIRYGYRTQEGEDLMELYTKSRSEGFGQEVQRRIILGTFVLSAGYFDAYYTQATKLRRIVRDATMEMFQQCDVILTPTAPTTAFKLGEKTSDPIEMFLSDIFTVHANLTGCPAISLPAGNHSNGLPIGIQLMGRPFEEDIILRLGSEMTTFSKI